jgi:hypothetical protein
MSPIRFFSRRASPAPATPVVQSRPVELKAADLKAVSGGGPKGSWAVAQSTGVIDGPKGAW